MFLYLDVACACHIGKVRSNNEDNLYFDGKILEKINTGLKKGLGKRLLLNGISAFAIFDGMGGEECGETASFLAATEFGNAIKSKNDYLISAKELLNYTCSQMNLSVCEASKALASGRMGSTMVSFLFSQDEVYACNIGDSRAYRLREKEFLQLSKDHVEKLPLSLDGRNHKPALTQYLGVYPDELTIEPYIAKGNLERGDQYLLCSDGLTDMVSNVEICSVLEDEKNTRNCVNRLVKTALNNGGKDNITVILCRVK